jgi:hypothetical protein
MGDVWFLYPGGIYGELEFKAGNTGLSKDQKIWRDFIISMGAIYIVVKEKNNGLHELKTAIADRLQ